MATWCVGDLQGCLDPLRWLLDEAHFDPAQDRLWLVGDLVNRGPDSLGALRFVHELGDAAVTVLGNHDLHLLAILVGGHAPRRKDTFDAILDAPDRDRLAAWLLRQPLVHFDAELNTVLVHAGVPFLWSLDQALARAAEVEAQLRSAATREFFDHMYGNEPAAWSDDLEGPARMRVITNYFTRMRFIDADGALDLESKEGIETAPEGYFPWFQRLHPDLAERRIVFGHWAALQGEGMPEHCIGLDTGCVWGNCMTLMRLEDGHRLTRSCGD